MTRSHLTRSLLNLTELTTIFSMKRAQQNNTWTWNSTVRTLNFDFSTLSYTGRRSSSFSFPHEDAFTAATDRYFRITRITNTYCMNSHIFVVWNETSLYSEPTFLFIWHRIKFCSSNNSSIFFKVQNWRLAIPNYGKFLHILQKTLVSHKITKNFVPFLI